MPPSASRAKKSPCDPADPLSVAVAAGDWKTRAKLSYKKQIEARVAAKTQKQDQDRNPNQNQNLLAPDACVRDMLPAIEDGPRTPGYPLWMPEGEDLKRMPVELRQAVAEIVKPAYDNLVVEASSGMDKSLGASIVYLLWLELLDQYDMKKMFCAAELRLGLDGNRSLAIEHYMKLLNAKLRFGNVLIRLRELRLKESRDRSSSPPRPAKTNPAEPLPLDASIAASLSRSSEMPQSMLALLNPESTPIAEKPESVAQNPCAPCDPKTQDLKSKTQVPRPIVEKAKKVEQNSNASSNPKLQNPKSKIQTPNPKIQSWKKRIPLSKTSKPASNASAPPFSPNRGCSPPPASSSPTSNNIAAGGSGPTIASPSAKTAARNRSISAVPKPSPSASPNSSPISNSPNSNAASSAASALASAPNSAAGNHSSNSNCALTDSA